MLHHVTTHLNFEVAWDFNSSFICVNSKYKYACNSDYYISILYHYEELSNKICYFNLME